MVFVALPCCNVQGLIEGVLGALFNNTTQDFHLSIFDNASTDNTEEVIRGFLSTNSCRPLQIRGLTIQKSEERLTAVEAINASLAPVFQNNTRIELVCKMDHDYEVPKNWDSVILNLFKEDPGLSLLCPSVDPSTPKGMQYFSQNTPPELVTKIGNHTLYHYTGIAGYCHCMRPSDFFMSAPYKPLNQGAVFGSEDADWSLRVGGHTGLPPKRRNAYVMGLQGFHRNKPTIGEYEDKWKYEATFLKTKLHWEDWAAKFVPEELKEWI